MSARSAMLRVGQVCLLLVVGWLLYHWWTVKPPVVISDDEVDDLIEQVGDTYVPVHVGNIERGTLHQYVTAYGTVEPAAAMAGHEAGSANVASPAVAVVATVNCAEGDRVEKSQPLFVLDSRIADAAIEQAQRLVTADQAAIEAMSKSDLATTKPDLATSKPDLATPVWRVANAQRQLAVDQAALERARIGRNLLTVVAPIAGTVTNLNIATGETADPSKTAVQIVDVDRLVASVDVPAASLADLRLGQQASIDLRSGNSTTQPAPVAGEVVLIDPAMNPATGMGSADISLPKDSGLRPGQFVRAQITTGEETDRLMVPTQSITQNQNGDSAIGKIEGDLETDGRWADLVPVKTGWRDGDRTEIEGEGLAAGQSVVTVEAKGLVRRTRVKLLRN